MLATKVLVMSKYVTFLKPTSCFWRTYQRKTGIPFPTNLSRIIVRFERKLFLEKPYMETQVLFMTVERHQDNVQPFPLCLMVFNVNH